MPFLLQTTKLVSFFPFDGIAGQAIKQMVPNSDPAGSYEFHGGYSSDRRYGSGSGSFLAPAAGKNFFLRFPTTSFRSHLLKNGAISVCSVVCQAELRVLHTVHETTHHVSICVGLDQTGRMVGC